MKTAVFFVSLLFLLAGCPGELDYPLPQPESQKPNPPQYVAAPDGGSFQTPDAEPPADQYPTAKFAEPCKGKACLRGFCGPLGYCTDECRVDHCTLGGSVPWAQQVKMGNCYTDPNWTNATERDTCAYTCKEQGYGEKPKIENFPCPPGLNCGKKVGPLLSNSIEYIWFCQAP